MFYRKPGFGLAEALVGSGIVVMVAAGSVGLGNSILKNTRSFSSQIVASNLAAEPIELIHYIRNKNIESGNPNWLDGLEECLEGCKIDGIRSGGLYDDPGELKFVADADVVDQIKYNDLNFERRTTITPSADKQKMDVKVIVTLIDSASTTDAVTEFNTTLTNWKVAK